MATLLRSRRLHPGLVVRQHSGEPRSTGGGASQCRPKYCRRLRLRAPTASARGTDEPGLRSAAIGMPCTNLMRVLPIHSLRIGPFGLGMLLALPASARWWTRWQLPASLSIQISHGYRWRSAASLPTSSRESPPCIRVTDASARGGKVVLGPIKPAVHRSIRLALC